MGFVRYLSLTDNAVPSVYTVGTSQSLTPVTRNVACQCHKPSFNNVSVQTETHKQKRRSKAVQVKPLSHSVGMSVGTGIGAPCLTSTPIKRPRMKETVFDESSTYTSSQSSDVTYEPEREH
ncbi:hypothetical protein R3I93_003162 [Phoxinus phoxinus]|uniref:Uncharacterized protein n=1 Tax=Phoxinus phoxinus TaxID=58324 RepID=A0AAN9DMC0_9TELE